MEGWDIILGGGLIVNSVIMVFIKNVDQSPQS